MIKFNCFINRPYFTNDSAKMINKPKCSVAFTVLTLKPESIEEEEKF